MDFEYVIRIRRSQFAALRVLRKYAREASRLTGAADDPLVEQVAPSGLRGLSRRLRRTREELADVRRLHDDGWRAPKLKSSKLPGEVDLAVLRQALDVRPMQHLDLKRWQKRLAPTAARETTGKSRSQKDCSVSVRPEPSPETATLGTTRGT